MGSTRLTLLLSCLLLFMLSFAAAACVDSDGGLDYSTKGSVTWSGSTSYDTCDASFSGYNLREYYCVNDTPTSKQYDCPYGCSDGACLSSTGNYEYVSYDPSNREVTLEQSTGSVYSIIVTSAGKGTVYVNGVGYSISVTSVISSTPEVLADIDRDGTYESLAREDQYLNLPLPATQPDPKGTYMYESYDKSDRIVTFKALDNTSTRKKIAVDALGDGELLHNGHAYAIKVTSVNADDAELIVDTDGDSTTETRVETDEGFFLIEPPQLAELTLWVFSSPGSQSIEDAVVDVALNGVTVASGMTDNQGYLFIDDLQAGTYTITVEATGYGEKEDIVTLSAGQEKERYLYLVSKQTFGALQVLVQEACNRDPLEDVEVNIQYGGSWHNDETNPVGMVGFGSIPAGTYTILVAINGYQAASRELTFVDGAQMSTNFLLTPVDGCTPVEEMTEQEYLDQLYGEVYFVRTSDRYSKVVVFEEHPQLNKVVSGAKVEIYKDGSLYDSMFTNTAGEAQFGTWEPGTYEVRVNGPDPDAWLERRYGITISSSQVRVMLGLDKKEAIPATIPLPSRAITLVGAMAPSSDVVNAANFAAGIQQRVDLRFTGMTNEQLRADLASIDFANTIIVRFLGKKYIVMASPEYHDVVAEIKAYLLTFSYQELAEFGPSYPSIERWLLPELDSSGYQVQTVDTQPTYTSVAESGCATGCVLDGKCLPFGIRMKNEQAIYCDIDGSFSAQKEAGEGCQNNYECLSNSCLKGNCIDLAGEVKRNRTLIDMILDILRDAFSLN